MKALLLDVDGTLVDSTYLHVEAWWAAFVQTGIAVPAVEIHKRIGMDAGQFVDELLDRWAQNHSDSVGMDAVAGRIKEAHKRIYLRDAELLRPLPGAQRLVREAQARGYEVVLCTTSSPEEFAAAREVLEVDDSIEAVTTGSDVDVAKPNPSVVELALERAEVGAEGALMVGDSVWDAVAATRAGVRAVAVRTGGIGEGELLAAGHERVLDDCEELLEMLDEAEYRPE